tara:strand:- start:69 stop:788 length:720 start_codon:yes stop_codon:yes gene_type:complete
MFSGYLETFHQHHTKYLYRLSIQLKLILKIINEDIKIKQFNQLDTTSKDNINLETNHDKNIVVNNNLMQNNKKKLLEENELNENNYFNSINLSDDTVVGRNSVTTDNSDVDSVYSMDNNISQEDIGKRVAVEGYDSIGTLLFYGKHAVRDSMRCGVEFDDPVGKHNGTILGHQYFKSAENKGVLVVPRKVTIINNDEDLKNNKQEVEVNEHDEDQFNEYEENQVKEHVKINKYTDFINK